MSALVEEVVSKSSIPETKYTAKDFQSDQDVRWCPGCGDYSILAQVQRIMPVCWMRKNDLSPFLSLHHSNDLGGDQHASAHSTRRAWSAESWPRG